MSSPARALSVRILRDGPAGPAFPGRCDAIAAAATRSIRTSHARIEIRTAPGTGTPLVLLHGRSRNKGDFSRLMASPSGRGRAMVAIDLPGHGGSGAAEDPDHSYTLDGYADAVIEVLEHLGIERAGVVGRSFGAQVGLRMAGAFPGFAGLLMDHDGPAAPAGRPRSAGGGPAPAPQLVWRADDRYRRIATVDRAPTAAELAAVSLSLGGHRPFLARAARRSSVRGGDAGREPVRCPAGGFPPGSTDRAPPATSLRRFLRAIDRVSPHLSLGLCLSG